MAVKDTVKQTAREEAERVTGLAQDAFQSAAWLYPIKESTHSAKQQCEIQLQLTPEQGMIYFASHRSLWAPLGRKILPAMTTGLAILGSMFFFTYLPQAALMTLFNGPIAGLTAALLVLSESSTIFMFVAKSLLVEDALIDTFDGTLIAQGQSDLVASERQVKSGRDPIGKLGKLVSRPFARFTPTAIIRYFMYLPLNFIPVIGTVIFVLLQGTRAGPSAHQRYFQLKGLDKARSEEFVQARKGAYTGFGTVAFLLEMIPIAGILFAFTNVAGAALWAADIERDGTTASQISKGKRKQIK